jgi:hypothetical protein
LHRSNVGVNSCFSHAVAIAEGKFLSKLSPSIKKKNKDGVFEEPSESSRAGELDSLEADEEDNEDDIQALEQEVEAAPSSENVKAVAKLLLKIRGFIAKVSPKTSSSYVMSIQTSL